MNAGTSTRKSWRNPWQGFGLWNVYFLSAFFLAIFDYVNLNLLWNAALACFIIIKIRNKPLNYLRNIIAVICGIALLWKESWLPGLDSFISNADNLTHFDLSFLLEVLNGAINWDMVAAFFVLLVLYLVLKDWVNVTTITVLAFIGLALFPTFNSLRAGLQKNTVQASQASTAPSAAPGGAESEAPAKPLPVLNASNMNEILNNELDTFYADQRKAKVNFPESLPEDQVPFDVILLNICSLAWDDLAASNIDGKEFGKKFDIMFTNFNSATSYSGPSTNRLLRSACGQRSHLDIYTEREPECEVLGKLEGLGFKPFLFMDHNGQFDEYLDSLKIRSGMNIPLSPVTEYKKAYRAFDGTPIYSDKSVFNAWLTQPKPAGKSTVTLFNLISLHDGNHDLLNTRSLSFKERAETLITDINAFMADLQKSGRNVMLVVVPEHGAAVRGEKVQVARIRDLPLPRITQVPVLVKFFGKNVEPSLTTDIVEKPSSFMGVTELINRAIRANVFAKPISEKTIKELTKDLPETPLVSENNNVTVMRYGDRDYIRMGNNKWIAKPKE